MNQRFFWITIIISIILIINSGGSLFAQAAQQQPTGYHVSVNGAATGPYDNAGLRQLVSQGLLTRNTLVWKEGMTNWVIAGTVAELSPILAAAAPPPLPPAQPAGPPALPTTPQHPAGYQNFTSGQRWGAFWVNALVPGVGSFAIMKDVRGGVTNLLLGVSGYTCLIIYNVTQGYETWTNSRGYTEYNYYRYPAYLYLGWGFYTAAFIQNIVRVSTYDKPQTGFALSEKDSWDIDVHPGKNGIESVSFSYTLRY